MPDKRVILCPYCGNTQTQPEDRCAACGGYFDSLSLKVTQEHMGPWFMRDRHSPFRPGMSYDVLKREIEKARIKPTTIIRGPTTRQFWSVARNVPGVAHLVGYCHACGAHVSRDDDNCKECGEVFFAPKLRDNLGLAPIGTDVQAKPRLSDSGAYEAVAASKAAPKADAAQAAPKAAAAAAAPSYASASGLVLPGQTHVATPPPPTRDQPVGSSILAGLRGDVAAGDAAAVNQATGRANAGRDAMSWLTPSADEEPDNLQTAGSATAPLPRSSSPVTWVLIGVNVLLLVSIVVIAAAVLLGRGGEGPPANGSPNRAPEPSGAGEAGVERTSPPPAVPDSDQNDLADPSAAGLGDVDDATPTSPPTPTTEADAEARQLWKDRFDQALQLEDSRQLNEALGILQQIKAEAPAGVQPAGLDAAIQRVDRKIRKAELDAIFE